MSMIKNMDKAQVMVLKEQVSYQAGQVVSKTLAQNDALSVTLFAFDKDEEISTNNNVKTFKVKGITIIANRNNGMVIGLTGKGKKS